MMFRSELQKGKEGISYPSAMQREGSHFFPKFGHFFPKTSYVHIYVIRLHTTLMQAFSSHTARASYRKKIHNIIIQTHTHNIHACCIWIHTRCSHHTTSFTACIINPSCIIRRCHIMISYSIIITCIIQAHILVVS